MEENKGIWIALGIIGILGLLLWWWYVAIPPSPVLNIATSTPATSTVSTAADYPVTHRAAGVLAIAESISGASRFASLLKSSGVASQIKAGGTYTIFVPTDGAFSQLPSGTIAGMTGPELKRLVQYHVVSGRAIDVDAQTAGSIASLSGDPLNFSYTSTHIPMVDSAIVVGAYEGTNGVVYLINRVLLPPAKGI